VFAHGKLTTQRFAINPNIRRRRHRRRGRVLSPTSLRVRWNIHLPTLKGVTIIISLLSFCLFWVGDNSLLSGYKVLSKYTKKEICVCE
jgi:hypothetical protein